MGPYRHQYHGGKRHKSTGVADYFAVLGMDVDDDLLFLRDPPPSPPPPTVPTSLPSQVSPSAASSSSPSNNDANKTYILQDNYAKEIDNAATGPDCTVITSPSSSEKDDTTKTPRNSRNLTKKLVPPQSAAGIEENCGTIEKPSTSSEEPAAEKDTNLHVERFDREIVELALYLPSSSTTTSAATTTADSRGRVGGRLKCCCWTSYTNDEDDGSCALPIVNTPGRSTRRRCMIDNSIQGGVRLAYRRRRCSLPDCCCRNVDMKKGEENCMHSGEENEGSRQPQHYYYTPGVADISIHYVKIRPSTIIFPHFYSTNFPVQQQTNNDIDYGQNHTNNRTDGSERTFSKLFVSRGGDGVADSYENGSEDGSRSRAGGVTARHLSSLARQGAGLLVNVVRKTASQRVPPPQHPSSSFSTMGVRDIAIEPRTTNNHYVDFDGEYIHNSLPASLSVDGIKKREHFFPDDNDMPQCRGIEDDDECGIPDEMLVHKMLLRNHLPLPPGYDEWVIPDFCETLHLPTAELVQRRRMRRQQQRSSGYRQRRLVPPVLVDRTHSFPSAGPMSENDNDVTSPLSVGMEAMYLSPTNAQSPNDYNARGNTSGLMVAMKDNKDGLQIKNQQLVPDPNFIPNVVSFKSIPTPRPDLIDRGGDVIDFNDDDGEDSHLFIPILAIRRQRIGNEERFHEDPSIVDIQVTHLGTEVLPPTISDEADSDSDDFGRGSSAAASKLTSIMTRIQSNYASDILSKTQWTLSTSAAATEPSQQLHCLQPVLMVRRNVPDGFSDIPFARAKVLGRFPQKNYRGMPFPEEEMPLFCYPGGIYLVRDKLSNWKLPRSLGFVVKNERGDSIFVTCLSFMEPVSQRRRNQLDNLSIRRRETSLPHRMYWVNNLNNFSHVNQYHENYLVRFDGQITFEEKTICLLGRYPFWTEFRRFLNHLHLLSGSSSDIPIERNISHLLLTVPMPKPGGQCVLVPFSTMNEPMALFMPPLKDLPLVDLSYRRLFAALDVPTVVTIVLGLLCLERKLILLSTRQSLLLDCCELLKSLLFPFDVCAPYVPHLTQPFMSCLEFPGAIFVGIHDDEQSTGFANIVRSNIPEEGIIVELDSGEINCDGNRYEILKAAYQIIPSESRALLIKEIEAICKDAGIVPGQEPLDFGVDSSCQVIETALPSNAQIFGKLQEQHDPLDDRSIRDSFLRFFCSILGGYERFLVVPDADFLTSGNDWFDSSNFVGTAPANRTPFLRTLVQTQLFQSFIQRRTEASDVHCMLFDECLAEYHCSKVSFGRLSCDIGSHKHDDDIRYFLLIDQCATEPDLLLDDDESSLTRSDLYNKSVMNDNETSTQASSGYADSAISDTTSIEKETQFAINESGDIVTVPAIAHLPPNAQFGYCVDGNPSFPTKFDRKLFLPAEPEFLEAESAQLPAPILLRSERERDDAIRLLNTTVSRRGPQKQHRCLWQLAKFMGSQFLGAYLMCIPAQLSQPNLSVSEKSKIMLRSLGALRTLRSHRRIVADEAAYRALIVACGRCGTDRRVELTKLYGLLRADGIFPNAVTLGQYTKALSAGYSNASVDESTKVGMQVVISSDTKQQEQEYFALEVLDNNLSNLEESGLKWRTGGVSSAPAKSVHPIIQVNDAFSQGEQSQPVTVSPTKTFDTSTTQRSLKAKRSWLPVCCSSSFLANSNLQGCSGRLDSIRLMAMWSRNSSCRACGYIPLDEEIQGGWDEMHVKPDEICTVSCPRCAGAIMPSICFKEVTVDEILIDPESANEINSISQTNDLNVSGVSRDGDLHHLPPQLESIIKNSQPSGSIIEQGKSGSVAYLSPLKLRMSLEELVMEYGEEVLERDRLRSLNPEVFFNLWWYSARFSLPLPLPVGPMLSECDSNVTAAGLCNYCSFASWDSTLALEACRSAANALMAAQTLSSAPDRLLREKLFDNPNTDNPLLSFFNLQNYAQGDWDHPDFTDILVALVKACETRQLLPVVECVYQRNQARESSSRNNSIMSMNTSFESAGSKATDDSVRQMSAALDCYRTILYLARYQCTTAFHAFFPTTTRPCKGYHFWCAQGTAPLPIFDRAFREAAENYAKQKQLLVPIPDVSSVALGFRSVFGHII